MLPPRPLPEPALVRRRQVGLARQVLAGRRADHRHARRRSAPPGSRPAPRQGQLDADGAARSATAASMPANVVAQHRHHVAVVGDEAELDVERGVLGQVADRVVRLGPEHRTDLVDPLEHADQRLLVELRRLGQVRRPAEVVDARTRSRRTRSPTRRSSACAPRRSRAVSNVDRKPRTAAAAIRNAAWPRGCRSATRGVVEQGRQASAVSAGRYRSNGGGSAAAEHAYLRRRRARHRPVPPGWRRPCPVTSTTDSSVSASSERGRGTVTTTWASPAASRTMRNATDFSSRRRWTQPAMVTVSPDTGGQFGLTGCVARWDLLWMSQRDPREVWASGILAVPPHLHRPARRAASCRAPARECLRAPAPVRLRSCRRLSGLAGRGRYSSPSSLLPTS